MDFDDYMFGPSADPRAPGLPPPPGRNGSAPRPAMTCKQASFEGHPIRIAFRPGEEPCIFADDSRDGIGSDMTAAMRGLHNNYTVADTVIVNGTPVAVPLIPRSKFFIICMMNHSPRLDSFRNRVASILGQVEDTGGYTADGPADPGADVDPVLASLDGARKAYVLARSAHQLGQSNRREIEDLRSKMGEGPTHWTVSAWCARNGVKITKDVAKQEGLNLSRICKRMGYVVPEDRVCMGSDYPSRRWPLEAIRIWWPDFKQREAIG